MRNRNWGVSALIVTAAAGSLCSVAAAQQDKSMSAREVHHAVPRIVDDLAALELANKLGLNDLRGSGLRGLPGCPNILTDGGQCHVANVALGANFSVTVGGDFRCVDNTTVTSSNPTRLCWIGRYANRVAPAVADESFQVRIFTDLNGLPNLAAGPIFDRMFSQSGSAGVDQLTLDCLDGQTCPGTTNPAAGGAFVYSAEVTAGYPLTAGQCYWFEIACNGSAQAGVRWGWIGSQAGTDLTTLQAVDGAYSVTTRADNDRSFCVSGGLDPFAGNCTTQIPPPVCENLPANGVAEEGAVATGFRASAPGSVGAAGVWTAFQRGENIQFPQQTTVSNACFEGFWLTNPGGTAIAPPANPPFYVGFYTNVAGVPGGPLPMAEFQNTVTPGVSVQFDATAVQSVGTVRVDFPPVTLQANTCYWLSHGYLQFANQPGMQLWHWALTTNSNPTAEPTIATKNLDDGTPWGTFVLTLADGCSIDPISNLNYLFNAGPVTMPICPAGNNPNPPSNDLCSNAIALTCGAPPLAGSTIGATTDNIAACGATTLQCGGGVWYTAVGTGGMMTVSMCGGPSYDAQMYVLSGNCGATVCVDGNDDFCGPGGTSQVTWASTAGTVYRILVHGFATDTGDFQITLTSDTNCGGQPVDCNGNGTPDSQEIAANPALDCYNPSVVANPHVIGGPDGALDACQCQGNFNRDGAVNSTDISAMLTSWLAAVQAGNANADINCSGSTNSTDISAFLTIWLAQVNNQVPFDGCP